MISPLYDLLLPPEIISSFRLSPFLRFAASPFLLSLPPRTSNLFSQNRPLVIDISLDGLNRFLGQMAETSLQFEVLADGKAFRFNRKGIFPPVLDFVEGKDFGLYCQAGNFHGELRGEFPARRAGR